MSYSSQGKLEERLFCHNEMDLIKEYTRAQINNDYKIALSEISGITNGKLLDKFLQMEIRPETLTSISLVPLIEVGWADGTLDDLERDSILKAVEKFGWRKTSIDYLLLARWLANKPEPILFDLWKEYIRNLCNNLSENEVSALKTEILSHATAVANASGGIMGIGKICAEEKAVLKEIENSFVKE